MEGGWRVVVVLTTVFVVVNWMWTNRQKTGWLRLRFNKPKLLGQGYLLFFCVGLGVLAGLFFNPYFPQNLEFYWQQSFKIAVVNYQYVIDVGGEWYPFELANLFRNAIPFFLLYFAAAASFIISARRQPMVSWYFLVLSLLFFVLTLKSRRYVEYLVPLGVVFSALTFNVLLENVKVSLSKIFPKTFVLVSPILLLLVFSPIFYRDIVLVQKAFAQGFPPDKFLESSNWLKDNTKPGDIVFHSDWDEFPILFYHNDQNYYIAGLDPTFTYEYDKDLYKYWRDITVGQGVENMHQIISEIFGAKYVLVDTDQNKSFDRNLSNNIYFQKVFEGRDANIYQILDSDPL